MRVPLLSVIVPCARPLPETRRLLEGLRRQSWDFANFEVLLVANGPRATDFPAGADLHSLPVRVLRLEGAPGANRARNLGATSARAEILLFMDDDVEPTAPDALEKAHRLLQAPGEERVVFGHYLDPGLRSWSRAYFETSARWMDERDFVPAGFMALRKELHGALDPFPDDIVFGGCELEFNEKLLLKDIRKISDPSFDVLHHIQVTFQEMLRKAWKQGQTQALFNRRHPKALILRALPGRHRQARLRTLPYFLTFFLSRMSRRYRIPIGLAAR